MQGLRAECLSRGEVWTVVRTKFIDDLLATVDVAQMVNLGAGVDTRAYRLDAFKRFRASYEVDTAEVSLGKRTRVPRDLPSQL